MNQESDKQLEELNLGIKPRKRIKYTDSALEQNSENTDFK